MRGPDASGDRLVPRRVVRKRRAKPPRCLARRPEALTADAACDGGIEIGPDHGQPVLSRQLEEGPVHREVGPALDAPAELPIDLAGARVAPDRGFERRLPRLRHHLECDRGAAAVHEQGFDDPRLDRVVQRIVVSLSQVHDLGAARTGRDQARRGGDVRFGLDDDGRARRVRRAGRPPGGGAAGEQQRSDQDSAPRDIAPLVGGAGGGSVRIPQELAVRIPQELAVRIPQELAVRIPQELAVR